MDNRPLSPHLTVYKPQITSVLSIFHRITGAGLAVSTVLVVFWLASLAIGMVTDSSTSSLTLSGTQVLSLPKRSKSSLIKLKSLKLFLTLVVNRINRLFD